MNKVLRFVFILAFSILSISAVAQEKQNQRARSDFIDRLRFGGYLGAQFGTFTFIEVSPTVTYVAKQWLYPGVGFTYLYFRDSRPSRDYQSSYYGPRFFVSVFLWRDLYAHAEYEALNVEYNDRLGERGFIHNIMLGGGYRQWIGNRAFVNISILYNFNESIYSPYRNPIFRIGFGVGI
jgi:hypothetical protein